jgi:hypothetical protein
VKRPLVAVCAVAVALASTAAGAETIYRCGNEYTNVACAEAKTIRVASSVTAEQRADAREVARRQKTLAAEMTRDRREQEALTKPALAGSLSAPPRTESHAPRTPSHKHPRRHDKKATLDDERDFLAAVPKTKKTGN